MNNQQDSFLQPDPNQKNQFNNHDENDNSISISAQNIAVKPNQIRGTPKKAPFDDNSAHMSYLQKQNSRLRKRNQELHLKLQMFTQKLDKELQKRTVSQNKKQRSPIKVDESVELKNAYKKIQIYKKQVFLLKNKLSSEQTQFKLNDYQCKLKNYMAQNQQLKQQLKIINKIVKQQQKGLSDIGADGFLKINQQNSKNKDEIRKLLMQIDQLKRKNLNNQNNNANNNNSNNGNKNNNQANKTIDRNDQNPNKSFVNQTKRKANSSFRMRTQPKMHKQQTTDITKDNQQKSNVQKLQQKLKKVNQQKTRQKQIIQNLKTQITQKDKELVYHKQKIQNLRVTIKLLKKKNQEKNKTQNNEQSNEKNENGQKKQNKSSKTINQSQGQNRNTQRQPPEPSACCPDQYEYQQTKKNQKPKKQQNRVKYPRLQQKGIKKQGTIKWNHHQFSSKIKQIQVYYHQLGFIYNIHLAYEKGQPAKVPNLDKKVCHRLQCQQDQYIQDFEGNFRGEYLQSLTIKTSYNKIMSLGKNSSQSDCMPFRFNIGQNEFPCALFGQNDQNGIRRLGCFIDKNI